MRVRNWCELVRSRGADGASGRSRTARVENGACEHVSAVRLHVTLGEPVNARSTMAGFRRCSDVPPVLASRRVQVD